MLDVGRGTTTRVARGLVADREARLVPRRERGSRSPRGRAARSRSSSRGATDRVPPAAAAEPSWSPDGARIAFAAPQEGDEEIFVARVDSGPRERLTHSPGATSRRAGRPTGPASRSPRAGARARGSRGSSTAPRSTDERRRVRGARADRRERLRPLQRERGEAERPRSGRVGRRRPATTVPRRRLQDGLRVCVIDVAGSRVYPLVAKRMVTAFALAPDGRSVAWTRDRQIIVVRPRGERARAPWSRTGGDRPGRGTAGRIAFLETAGSDPSTAATTSRRSSPTAGIGDA